MSDIKLFRYSSTTATELAGKAVAIEKTLQNLIEAQMETFLGVRFLASEYGTGNKHRGRIDSLGLDENGCPVIHAGTPPFFAHARSVSRPALRHSDNIRILSNAIPGSFHRSTVGSVPQQP